MSCRYLWLVAPAVALATACLPKPEFYRPPDPLPAAPGTVVRTYPVLLAGTDVYRGTAALYGSTTATGDSNAVSGTVYEPKQPWPGPGGRPLIAFAPGPQGQADHCRPSQTLPLGGNYEQSTIVALLDRGWAVAVTDYPPRTDGLKDAQAHALLDVARAAQRLPESAVTPASPVGLWGYSLGGQAAAAAAELEATYAPELDVRGTVAGSVPSDLLALADHLEGPGADFAALLAFVAAGLELPASADPGTGCAFEALAQLKGEHLDGLDTPQARQRLDDQRLGTVAPAAPVLLFHGNGDQAVPFRLGTDLRDAWRRLGAEVELTELPVEHVAGIYAGTPKGAEFLASRFA